jgi:hypothetical protein
MFAFGIHGEGFADVMDFAFLGAPCQLGFRMILGATLAVN